MVHLTKIYTKTGDNGTTALGDMSRTSKNDPRIEAYATVDEANSQIGMILAFGKIDDSSVALLSLIQNELFDLGADLATPVSDKPALRITEKSIKNLEEQIDQFNSVLTPLRSFVLPNGGKTSVLFHVARTVVRRAERRTWAAIHAFGDGVNVLTAQYLNRLSDLLFVMSRVYNLNEELWVPGGERGTV